MLIKYLGIKIPCRIKDANAQQHINNGVLVIYLKIMILSMILIKAMYKRPVGVMWRVNN